MLRYARVTERKNLLTGETVTRLKQGQCPAQFDAEDSPAFLRVAGLGDNVFLVFRDGRLLRFDTRNPSSPVLVERRSVLDTPHARVRCVTFLIGKTSLVVGDSEGNIGVWFRIKPDDASTPDGVVLVRGHLLHGNGNAVTALAPSLRSRIMAAGYADGTVRLFHVTSEQQLAEGRFTAVRTAEPAAGGPDAGAAVRAVVLAPKDDHVLALARDRGMLWRVHAPHPEITWRSVFGKVWYEGYPEPEHVWQSSSGSDAFEPKYGLVPLIFGTIKATFYSMLFGAPLALLAAVYTSEFLHPRWKKRVKPTIEMMASLPSVVLGFLAALFFAPIVERIVPETLTALATVPFAVLWGAYLWQLLPIARHGHWHWLRIPLVAISVGVGLQLAAWLGPVVERTLFAGDVMLWLDGQIGTGTAGWMFLSLPLSALMAVLIGSRWVAPAVRRRLRNRPTRTYAVCVMGQFLLGSAAVIAVAWLLGAVLNQIAWDPRGTFVGTYVQRNAFVVGIVMGFAVIPIIYTVSDDALSAVPESLRAASLGAGATPWQTALRVVVPTAMSGLFSALMIGLGRAVGETMIVLMAAGNTPIIDWNIFSGFRTLSANIAVEMPEAVKGSTHFRMLFLAALTLFLMTFVLNTIAETIRLRFRKKAFEL
ncbi:MAG: ABC transporter permease subunit [Planctomycetota bacterium]|nr:MAG: ABC transporter permease subunit [Planctomycetota bacterium]